MKWKKVKLSSVSQIISGATPRRNDDLNWNGDIPWATPKELSSLNSKYLTQTQECITQKGFDSCSATLLPKNSVLFSSRAPIGLVAINTIDLCTNQGFKSFIPDKDKLDSSFLYYWLHSHKRQIQDMGRGATFKEVSKSIVAEIEIPLPPLKVQKQIVEILDLADELKKKKIQAVDKFHLFIQSSFSKIFGDVKNNQYGWDEANLEELASKIIDCPHSTPDYSNTITNYPCIRTTELKDGNIDWTKMKYLDEENHKKRNKRSNVIPGDIVYGREGSFGDAIIVPENTQMSLGQRVMMFRPKDGLTNSEFLWALLRSQEVYNQAQKLNSGSTVGHVNIKDIKKFKVFIPPIDIQIKFSKLVKRAFLLQTISSKAKFNFDNLFNSLLQQAFNGELKGLSA